MKPNSTHTPDRTAIGLSREPARWYSRGPALGGALVANTMWWLVLQQNIPAEKPSRVTSYEWFGTLAHQPIGFALVGPLAARIGTSSTLYLCGGLSLLVRLSLLAVRDVRTLENKATASQRLPP